MIITYNMFLDLGQESITVIILPGSHPHVHFLPLGKRKSLEWVRRNFTIDSKLTSSVQCHVRFMTPLRIFLKTLISSESFRKWKKIKDPTFAASPNIFAMLSRVCRRDVWCPNCVFANGPGHRDGSPDKFFGPLKFPQLILLSMEVQPFHIYFFTPDKCIFPFKS